MPTQAEQLEQLANRLLDYYHQKSFPLRVAIRHPMRRRGWYDEWEGHKRVRASKETVDSCAIEPYSPDSKDKSFHKTFVYEPPPTHQIRVTLKHPTQKQKATFVFPCAADASGEFKLCNAVFREPTGKEKNPAPSPYPPPPATIDMRAMYDELKPQILGEFRKLHGHTGKLELTFVRYQFSYDPYPDVSVSLYPNTHDFDPATYEGQAHLAMLFTNSKLLGAAIKDSRAGTPTVVSLNGEKVDLQQDKFEQQFPEWIGTKLIRKEIKSTLMQLLADCLVELEKEGVLGWKGRKVAIVETGADFKTEPRTLQPAATLHGIEIFEIAPAPAKPASAPAELPPRPKIAITNGDGKPKVVATRAGKPVTLTAAIAAFKELMTPFIASPPATGREVVDAVAKFYREVGIKGADDSLMIEWGAGPMHQLKGFVDLRKSKKPPQMSAENYEWISLTRQVHAGREDDDPALCAYLYFEPTKKSGSAGMIEFFGLEPLDEELAGFFANKTVAQLLATQPSKVNGFVSTVG